MAKWAEALQSWNIFCSTRADKIFTQPSGLDFNMTQFKSKMCSLDILKLTDELTEFQGIDKLIEQVIYDIDLYVF